MGETSADDKFSITCPRCEGASWLAPVIMVGEKTSGRESHDNEKVILKKFE